MKVICERLSLEDAVMKVSKAISSKTTKPILEGIKITAKEQFLIFEATDLEISIIQKINAEVYIEGETVVPGRAFTDFIKKITSGLVELNLLDKALIIKYDDSKATFQCMNPSEFPPIERVKSDNSFSVLQKEFKDMVSKTNFCVSQDDARPILKGILIEVEEYLLKAVALDGYRMALVKKPLEKKCGKHSIIIPAKTLNEISKLIESEEDVLTVWFSEKLLMCEIDNLIFVSKLIDGNYIDYSRIIPTEFTTSIVVKKNDIDKSLERACIIIRGIRSNIVNFDIQNEILNITSDSETGNINENIQINKDGNDMKISFNPKYFTDITKVVDDEFLKINFKSETTNPAVIVPIEGEDFLYIVLPVKKIY